MWPVGHAAVAYLCYSGHRTYSGLPPGQTAVIALLIGSQFPDLVDKPLAWQFNILTTGRSLAHSLFVLLPLVFILYALARRRGQETTAVAFGIGAISHTFADAVPALWGTDEAAFLLWPWLSITPYEGGSPAIMGLLLDSLGDPFFFAEFVLGVVAIVLWRRDGYPGLRLITTTVERGRTRLGV